jgi:hypothetical protein
MSDRLFTTRSRELAAFLHFAHPDKLRAISKINERAVMFEFAEPSVCAELQRAFYNRAGVDDAKALLETAKFLRDAAYKALNDPAGVWLREDEKGGL